MIKQDNGERRDWVGAGIVIALFVVSFIVFPRIVTREEAKMRRKRWKR